MTLRLSLKIVDYVVLLRLKLKMRMMKTMTGKETVTLFFGHVFIRKLLLLLVSKNLYLYVLWKTTT